MKISDGALVNGGCYIFPDSGGAQPPVYDISSPLNVFTNNYLSSNEYSYVYHSNSTNSLVGVSGIASAPTTSNLSVFYGEHNISLQTFSPVTGGSNEMNWWFYGATTGDLKARVIRTGTFSAFTTYTVNYNNGIQSVPAGASIDYVGGPAFTDSTFRVYTSHGFSGGGSNLPARGYYH